MLLPPLLPLLCFHLIFNSIMSGKNIGAKENREEDDPAKKRAKLNVGNGDGNDSNAKQTNLLNFFKSSSATTQKKSPPPAEQDQPKKEEPISSATETTATTATVSTDPIFPTNTTLPRNNVFWESKHDNNVLIRRISKDDPRTKVAAFDLEDTLMLRRMPPGQWPSQLHHYELWNAGVIQKLRDLYDHQGYKLLVVSNQGGVQRAHTGKKATLIKTVIDWLAHEIGGDRDRPLYAVMSTRSIKKAGEGSFHKPTPKMWQVAIQMLNKGTEFSLNDSFFVGDSADPSDDQGGVDRRFAENVGTLKGSDGDGGGGGGTLKFYTPDDYFGPSDSSRRQAGAQQQRQLEAPPPPLAHEARAALLGGYLQGPILVILCGIQGSGKSTFCERLLSNTTTTTTTNNGHWIHLSQDTISNGKPGKREKVEAQAKAALEDGHSVAIDRTHLNPAQRNHFIEVAKAAQVPVHVVVLNPPTEVATERVRVRTNHPGKVDGDKGVKIALMAAKGMVLPTYAEDVELISCTATRVGADRLANLYSCLINCNNNNNNNNNNTAPLEVTLGSDQKTIVMPTIALGMYKVGKRVAQQVVRTATETGFCAIDTAPTYNNEDIIGKEFANMKNNMFFIAKVPKRATTPQDVRSELEQSLKNLQRDSVDLLLLHWPCDVMAQVWNEMEQCCAEGKCKALGVCNFNVAALASLLSNVKIRPVVNQVERHPLLPQMDLVDFCARNDILIQAHSPLGQGKENLLGHSVIAKIAKESSMSPAQVVCQWNLQQGVAIVPKCSSKEHGEEMFSCKMLSPQQMKELDTLGQTQRFVAPPFMYGNAAYCWGDRMPH
jgi:DNA 3'-phosphatase